MTIVRTVRRIALGGSVGGGDSPALGHVGYDFDLDTATDDEIRIDLRMPTNTYDNKIWLAGYPDGILDRAGTATYQSNGGYWGEGCLRFVPGAAHGNEENDPSHEMSCGIGQLYGLNAVAPGGVCRRLTIGVLVTYGASFWQLGGGGKPMIVLRANAVRRDNGASRNTRPMVISDNVVGAAGRGIGPHDGTIGNFTTDPDGEDYFNEFGIAPDQEELAGVSQWIQFEVDLLEGTDGSQSLGQARLKIWTADGELAGTPVLAKNLYEDVGGDLPTIDIIMGWARTVQSIDAGYYYDLEYIKISVGQDTGMTPPRGFPGSTE
jgi:hypothetical protein